MTPITSIHEVIHHTNRERPTQTELSGSHTANDPCAGGKESKTNKAKNSATLGYRVMLKRTKDEQGGRQSCLQTDHMSQPSSKEF